MAFFKTKTDAKSVKETTGGGGFISKSGIYSVRIERAAVSKTRKSNATSLDITLATDSGASTTFYNNIVETSEGSSVDKNGKLLPGGALLNKIAVIAGLDEIDDPEEQKLKLGKNNKEVTLYVLTDLDEIPLKVQVQEEYSVMPEGYESAGEISRKLVIRSVFRTDDNATAEEILADAEGQDVTFGSQYAIIEEKFASKITLRDNLTEEDVEAWKKAQAENSSTTKPKTPVADVKKKTGSIFQTKKA